MLVSQTGPTFLFNTSCLPEGKKQEFDHELEWKSIDNGEASRFTGGGYHSRGVLSEEYSWILKGGIDYGYDPNHVQEMLDIAIDHRVPALRMPESMIKEFGPLQIQFVLGNLLEQGKGLGQAVQGTTNFAVKTGMFVQYFDGSTEGDQDVEYAIGNPERLNGSDNDIFILDPGDRDFQDFLRSLFHFFHGKSTS